MHIGMEWFKTVAGFPLEHIPYKGAAAAQVGLLAGDTHAQVTTGLTADPHIKAGKLKVIATSGPTRQPAYPDVPTLAESGYPTVTLGYYLALLAPAGTPMNIVRKISTDFHKVMREPAFRGKYIDPYGIELIADTPEEFAEFLKRDMVAAESKVKASGARLD
jgi:tripartite-type tricarboxylate transporter receptor subunit TctC